MSFQIEKFEKRDAKVMQNYKNSNEDSYSP